MLNLFSLFTPAQTGILAAAMDSTSIVVVGFLFVMVVLVLLSGVTAVMGAFFSKQAAREARRAAEASAKAAASAGDSASAGSSAKALSGAPVGAQETPGGIEPELIAVIAAAVHTVVGERPHRIVSIQHGVPGWAQEGRRQIFSSHRVR